MVHVTHVEIDGTNVITVDSVFDVLHILMGLGETGFSKVVNGLLLGENTVSKREFMILMKT